MVSLRSGDTKFWKLSPELKLMATKNLPFDDKIKLVDVFRPVIYQIDTFDATKFTATKSKMKDGVKLFHNLDNVTKVLLPRLNNDIGEVFGEAISNCKNKKLQSFIDTCKETPFKFDKNIIKYIRNMRTDDPSYDASHIDKIFFVKDQLIINLLKDYKDLKLKIWLGTREFRLFDKQHPASDNIRDLITMLAVYECQMDTLRGVILPSVSHLQFTCGYHRNSVLSAEMLTTALNLTPNVSKLTLLLNYEPILNSERFARCLLSIPKLEQLEIKGKWYCRSEKLRDLESLLSSLLVPRQNDLLTRLTVDFFHPEMDVGSIVAMDIKDGFKFLNFKDSKNDSEFMVKKSYMLINNIQLPIVDTFNKFSHVKYIDVITWDRKYEEQLYRDIEVVRGGLPRNRNVTLTVRKY